MPGRLRQLASLAGALCGAWLLCAPPAGAQPALPMQQLAAGLRIDMTAEALRAALRGAGLVIEQERDLPPDRLARLLVAVRPDDDCRPRAEPWLCPAIRVLLLRDGARGWRIMRIEAFDRADGWPREALREAAARLAPPAAEAADWSETVRGGRMNLWRLAWRDARREELAFERTVAQWGDAGAPAWRDAPDAPAVGLGFTMIDGAAEELYGVIRRQRPQRVTQR